MDCFVSSLCLIVLGQIILRARSCSRDYIQICENCKAASQCNGAREETGITDIDECKEMCRLNTTCNLAEYITNASKCVMYSCHEVEIDAGSAVIRKTCTADCGRFRVKKILNRVGTCEFLLLGCTLTETACGGLCYDISGCRGFSHNTFTVACNLHKCTMGSNRIVEWNFTARECLSTTQLMTPPSNSIDTLTCQQILPDTKMPLMETSPEKLSPLRTFSVVDRTTNLNLPFTESKFRETMIGRQHISGMTALNSTAINSTTLRQTLSPTLHSSRKPSTTVLDKDRKSLINGAFMVTLSAVYQSTTETSSSSPESLYSNSKQPISYNRELKLKCLSCKMNPSILLIILLFSAYSSQKL